RGTRCATSASRSRWSWPRAGGSPKMPPRWSRSSSSPSPPSPIRVPVSNAARPGRGSTAPDNLVAHWVVQYGDVEAAFAGAAHRLSEHFRLHKGGGHSLETRAVLAHYDAGDDMLTVWDSTQMPHKSKRVLVEALGLTEERVRVIAPDVGGGFGPKNPFYPEELAIPAAALALGRPIKWIEDRRERFTATNHERDHHWDIDV